MKIRHTVAMAAILMLPYKPVFAEVTVVAVLATSSNFNNTRRIFLRNAEALGLDGKIIDADVRQMCRTSKRYGTSEQQIISALNNLNAILDEKAQSKLFDADWRGLIVENAMHNLAYPTQIEQGRHPTCNVSTLEVYAAARYPDQYTDLLKQVILSERFKTSDGTFVTPPPQALLAEGTPSYAKTPYLGHRNIASQIVQMTLINGLYESGLVTRRQRIFTPTGVDFVTIAQKHLRYILGSLKYKHPQKLGGLAIPTYGQDMLVELDGTPAKNEQGEVLLGPELTQEDVTAASKMFLGHEMPTIKAPYQRSQLDPLTGKVLSSEWVYDFPTKDRLLKAKQDGKCPIGVTTRGGAHAQTIHDVGVDERGVCWVLIDDQYDDKRDGWITLDELNDAQRRDIEPKPKYAFNDNPCM